MQIISKFLVGGNINPVGILTQWDIPSQDSWQGVLHHVCGEHSWAESSCNHGPHVEGESSKKPLDKSSKTMAALRKIVLDKKWLQNLHFYVRFR